MKAFLFSAAIAAVLYCAYFVYPDYAKHYFEIITINSESTGVLPRNFHMTPQQASGSSQFSEDGLMRILQVVPHDKVLVVDLREEPHGFLNGISISWYYNRNWLNEGKSEDEIIRDEDEKLTLLSKSFVTILHRDKKYPIPFLVKTASPEEEIVKKYGAEYFRLPVKDHVRPSDANVDQFVSLVKELKGSRWPHFHCSAGKGRSTTFLALYDMMSNASKTSLEEIIARQHFYGGIDLFEIPDKKEWKYPHVIERMEFLKQFYLYCRAYPSFDISWTSWVNSQKNR